MHSVRVPYFQGPGDTVALVLEVAGPGEQPRIFSTDEFQPSPTNPEEWRFPAAAELPSADPDLRGLNRTAFRVRKTPGAGKRNASRESIYRDGLPMYPIREAGEAHDWPDHLEILHYGGELGRGAMGIVFKAQDVFLGRFIALKILAEKLAKDPEMLSRFEREGAAASALHHPNICTVYDSGNWQGRPYLAMELMIGRSLDDRLSAASEDR